MDEDALVIHATTHVLAMICYSKFVTLSYNSECHPCSLSIIPCWKLETSVHGALLASAWSPSGALRHNFDLCA